MTTPLTPMVPFAPAAAGAPELETARRAAAGDTAAVADLLRSVRGPVVSVVRRLVGGNFADAEDAVQQSLIGFIQALPSYRGDGNPIAFAKTIAVRTALALRQRSRARSAPVAADCDTDTLESEQPSPSERVVAERRRSLLRQLLTEIPPEQAEALAMRIVLGWSLEEIAQQSGAPINTVRSRIRLAKEALRRRIEESGLRDDLAPA